MSSRAAPNRARCRRYPHVPSASEASTSSRPHRHGSSEEPPSAAAPPASALLEEVSKSVTRAEDNQANEQTTV
eukprot:2651875-Pleurochrysis_carterae.AAC.1